MRRFKTILAVAAAALSASLMLSPTRANPDEGVTFMKTLSEWAYPGTLDPGSRLTDGSMSDGGNPKIQSIKFRAILTTSDPISKVIRFYSRNLEPSSKTVDVADLDAKSISSQDDSEGRPVAIRVFVVNRDDTSTTLVISRAEGEKETHIAWSHYLRLSGKK
jgi:hypothetical protein